MGRDLAQRAQTASAAVAAAPPAGGPPTLAQQIERMKPEIARALPKHMDPDRVARIALTVLKQTPKLADCDPATFLGALMTASQLGLEPGPLGESYLVPYGRTVTFIPGYRGLAKLAWQSGQVESITAEVVGENDEFDFQMGDDPHITHRPSLDDPGRPIAAYAVIRIKGGGVMRGVMSVAAIEKVRKRSRAASSGPWVTDWDEMAKKTVLKRTLKLAPLSTELQTAANLDGSVRTDIGHLETAQVTHEADPDTGGHRVIEQAPAGGDEDDPTAPVTADQLADLLRVLAAANLDDPDGARATATEITGRDIADLTDLRSTEAQTIIDTLTAVTAAGAR